MVLLMNHNNRHWFRRAQTHWCERPTWTDFWAYAYVLSCDSSYDQYFQRAK